jgi:hypothetical protein
MGKTFGEYMTAKRRTITFEDGTDVVLRRPSYALISQFGPVPGLEEVSATQRQIEVARRLVTACVIQIGDEVDPIGRGLMTFEDFTRPEVDAIVDGVSNFMQGKGADDAGVPLDGTDSPTGQQHSSTVSDNVTTVDPQPS